MVIRNAHERIIATSAAFPTASRAEKPRSVRAARAPIGERQAIDADPRRRAVATVAPKPPRSPGPKLLFELMAKAKGKIVTRGGKKYREVSYHGQRDFVEVKAHRRKNVKVSAYCRRKPGGRRRRNTPSSEIPF